MIFHTRITNAEKLEIYERVMVDAHKLLLERLLIKGIDPETFDKNSTTEFAEIDEVTAKIKSIETKIQELLN